MITLNDLKMYSNYFFFFLGIQEVDDEDIGLLKEVIAPKKKIPTLLKRLVERIPERIDYIGTSYGLTKDLLKFWKSLQFVPVYLSQRSNDLTAEHSCIMLYVVEKEKALSGNGSQWLSLYFKDFRRRIIKLLGSVFKEFPTHVGLSLLDNKHLKPENPGKFTLMFTNLYKTNNFVFNFQIYQEQFWTIISFLMTYKD